MATRRSGTGSVRHGIVGKSPAIRAALSDLALVAPTAAAVLLHGESGSGKELFARELHRASGRLGDFVAVNCAAIPEAILESMLFGHRRGAFTGADRASPGLIAAADRGTLFLDEIAELPAAAQGKLLRVLQQRAVLAVGETRERPVDVRVVTASHRGLADEVEAGRFRADLYYRLARFEIDIPPLRERGDDVVLVARHILRRGLDGLPPCSLRPSAEPLLLGHDWPGNVRELENVLFRAALRAGGDAVGATQLAAATPVFGTAPVPLRDRVVRAVADAGTDGVGSRQLAVDLGVSRPALKRAIGRLVEGGEIATQGTGRGTRYVVRSPADDGLEPREVAALRIARKHGRVTRASLANASDLPTRTAGRVLARLVEKGRLRHDGRKGNMAGYVLEASGPPRSAGP